MSQPVKKMTRLGLFGGTFDPVHLGHLLFAQDALEQMRLDAVIFIPCRRSPHKNHATLVKDRHRLALLRAALRGEKRFHLSRVELNRPGPSYAIETVETIARTFPRALLFWLIGADQLTRLSEWHRAADLKKQVKFILESRGEITLKRAPAHVLGLPRPRRIDISATEIRRRVKEKRLITHLVPPAVATYITRHRLYAASITE